MCIEHQAIPINFENQIIYLKGFLMPAVLPFINAELCRLPIQERGCTMGVMNFFSNNRSNRVRTENSRKCSLGSGPEKMEDRILMSASPWAPDLGSFSDIATCDVEVSYSSDTGNLSIIGSSCDDTVSVENGWSGLKVTANGETTSILTLKGSSVDLVFFSGLDGDDHFNNTTGIDTWAFGGDGADTIQTSSGDDWVSGQDGNDVIKTRGGSDLVSGADGDDRIYSGSGNDTVYGHHGNDYIKAGSGHDIVEGGTGNDVI